MKLTGRFALITGRGPGIGRAIADAAVVAATSPIEETGTCWVAEYGRPVWPMEFADVFTADRRLNAPVSRN